MILGEEADQQHQTVSTSITKIHGPDRTSGRILFVQSDDISEKDELISYYYYNSGKKRETVLQVVDRSC